MRKKTLGVLLIITFLNISLGYSQCDPLEDPFCQDPDTPIPLDDHVIVLIAGAILFAIWKLAFGKRRMPM